MAEENIFWNYRDDDPATIAFTLSNAKSLVLYFPERDSCYLIGRNEFTPAAFKSQFNYSIGFVPILGPVEHNEELYEKEAARLALFNYRAARNFRNIWYHYKEHFEEFRSTIQQTWPSMDIQAPVVDISHGKARLYMFCQERRFPREIFWSGFGFQVWCQMLTHLLQSKDKSIFLIDEPDIYLHSELQRQLPWLLRNLGPDVLIATHSTEIITEDEPDEIVFINKNCSTARRLKNPEQIENVFAALGSNMNPILTQLAKTRRAVFVEGKDFQIVSKFAQKMHVSAVGNRREFAIIPIEGFNPERARSLKSGMEITLGGSISAALILDRDFRCCAECQHIESACSEFCDLVIIHSRKEIENFLLVASAIDRAAANRLTEKVRRGGSPMVYAATAESALEEFCGQQAVYVTSQILTRRKNFERSRSPGLDESTITQSALHDFQALWADRTKKMMTVPGKEALSFVNRTLRDKYGINVTPFGVIDAMHEDEVPAEIATVVRRLERFAETQVRTAQL